MISSKRLNYGITVVLVWAVIFSSYIRGHALAIPVTMSTKKEVLALIQRQVQGWENGNEEAICSDFAEDAVFIVDRITLEGKGRIKAAATDYFNQFTDTQVTIKRIIIEGDKGALEWDWRDRHRQSRQVSHAEDAIIWELANGKIVYWREYINQGKTIQSQGVTR